MKNHFDCIAPVYDRFMGSRHAEKLKKPLKLPAGGWLLDAGGGTARVSFPLRQLVSHLVVSDLSYNMLKQAGRKGLIFPVRAHAERLPFPDACFSRIMVVDALHHFCDQKTAVMELARVLSPAGRILIEEPDIRFDIVKLLAVAEKIIGMGSRFWSPEEIKKMMTAQGLRVSIKKGPAFRAWIIGEKPRYCSR